MKALGNWVIFGAGENYAAFQFSITQLPNYPTYAIFLVGPSFDYRHFLLLSFWLRNPHFHHAQLGDVDHGDCCKNDRRSSEHESINLFIEKHPSQHDCDHRIHISISPDFGSCYVFQKPDVAGKADPGAANHQVANGKDNFEVPFNMMKSSSRKGHDGVDQSA